MSIGDKLRPIATKFLTPVLVHVLPGDYHGWIVVIINWICKAVAISIAWCVPTSSSRPPRPPRVILG